MEKYLNIDELSKYIKLSKSNIYKRVSSRRIPYIKSGKKLLFKKEAIDEWLNEQAHQPICEYANNFKNILK